MKKPELKTKFPLLEEEDHIYNLLIDEGYHSINLGWANFMFVLEHDLHHDGDKVDGLTEFCSKAIKLELNLSDSDARETIIHEIIHCLLESSGLDEKNFDGHSIFTTNEYLVVALTKQLTVFNALNPGLMPLLMETK